MLVAGALIVILAGCKVDTTVSIHVNDDGSGKVTVSTVLDPDAVKSVEGGGGKLEARVRLGDLAAAGWKAAPWARGSDGSAQLVVTKPFSSPEQLAAIVKEISGTTGPLRDVTLTRSHGLLATDYHLGGRIDLGAVGTGVTGDPALVAALTNQKVDVAALDAGLLATLRDSVRVRVVVHTPGGSATVVGVPGKAVAIDASGSKIDARRIAFLGAAVALALGAVLVLLWPGRSRRRRRRAGTGSVPTPGV